MDPLPRLAELAVALGANVQPGQVVRVAGEVAHVELVRAIADAAYRRGARYVDADLTDPALVRSRVLHTTPGTPTYSPRWRDARFRELDDEHGASIKIVSGAAAGVFDDLDPVALSRALPPRSRVWRDIEYRVNNTVIAGPTEPWARTLRPELEPAAALAALWDDVTVACRLDEPDPIAVWRARFADLRERADALTALRLDAVHLVGPGTDLVVGLPPTARWEPPSHVNKRGIEHVWNLPSEEIYTAPDRDRVEGHVRLTSPAVVAGRLVHDVTLTFRDGRVAEVTGSEGVDALRAFIARDEGTARLGELALVDGAGAVGSLGRTFGLILFDENRASHVALGYAYSEVVDPIDRPRVNESADHLDVTVGSDEVTAVGMDATGREHALLRGGRWQ